jgi:hypothetical protein
MHDDLINQTRLEALLGNAGAEYLEVPALRRFARSVEGALEAVEREVMDGSVDRSWRR